MEEIDFLENYDNLAGFFPLLIAYLLAYHKLQFKRSLDSVGEMM